MKTEITAAQCPNCKTVVISAHRHDYHPCPCKQMAIDGGRDYVRMSFTKIVPKTFRLTMIGLTFQDLYEDADLEYTKKGKRKLTTLRTKNVIDTDQYRYTLSAKSKLRRYKKV